MPEPSSRQSLTLLLAQGLGVGRIPFAPGTFGSFLGFAWFVITIAPRSLAFYALATIAGLAVSVWASSEAEKILGKTDPGSVVIDEIAAIPICFAGWILTLTLKNGAMPAIPEFLAHNQWVWSLGVVLAFRLFDIWKPWPIGPAQKLPGGWGITIDDALAGLIVGALSALPFLF